MQFLKQSTDSQSRKLGPFVDDTDGTTAETGLTIANTDIRLSQNGVTLASKNSGGGTHDALGYYTITFDDTDTATVGELRVICKMSGALIVDQVYWVLEEAVYDALFGAGATGGIAATLADGAITAAKIATDAIAGAKIAADAVTKIQTGLATPTNITAATGVVLSGVTHTGAVIPTVSVLTGHTAQTGDSFARIGATGSGLTTLATASALSAMQGNVTDILADTNELQSDDYPTSIAAIATEVGKIPRGASAITAGGNATRTKVSANGTTLVEAIT